MQRKLLFLFCTLSAVSAFAQTFKGVVINEKNEAVSFATVYIHELTSGIVADKAGEFRIKLKAGVYTVEFRSIGYETQLRKIEVPENGIDMQVKLSEKIVELNEVQVRPSNEDPAYRIMRQTIARAPYHLYQVSNFTAENYVKGSAKIEKIPKLMKSMINDKKMESLIGKLLFLESQSLVTFKSPGKYTQKVLAMKSSIPKELQPKSGLTVSMSSIYNSEYKENISPLSSKAFSYYKFKLEDVFTSGKNQINKIRITPRYKNEILFSGVVYIVDGEWSVYASDLSNEEMGTTTRFKENYQEVQPSVYLPITNEMYTDIRTMGVKGFARYYSSIKYNSIQLNPSASIIQNRVLNAASIKPITKKETKTLQQIEKLSEKEKLSTIDALRLSKLLATVTEPKEMQAQRENLEIKRVENLTKEVDSLAEKRDDIYWDSVRNVPLGIDEAESFKNMDTLPPSKKMKTINNGFEISISSTNKSLNWLRGGNVKIGKTGTLFYDGLLKGLLKEYNFVDGAWLGQGVRFSTGLSKSTSLSISPSVYYTTARKEWVWNVVNKLRYAPMKSGLLELKLGNTTDDIQKDAGVSRLYNSLSSLILGDNAIRFYQKKYVSLENSIDLSNGFRLTTGVSYENRKLWSNQTDFHIFGDAPKANYPDKTYADAFPDHSATTFWAGLEYTPKYKYRIEDGKKVYVSSDYPTFALNYTKAFALSNKAEQSKFDKIDFSIHQNIRVNDFNKIKYKIAFGAFLNKSQLYSPDYKYFAVNSLLINDKPFDNTFNLLNNYSSSADKWAETHLTWTSDYLLLKRIGFMQTFQFNESLHLNSLWMSGYTKPYTELGYSIGFGSAMRVGVFTGFDGLKYQHAGVKISLPIFSLSEK